MSKIIAIGTRWWRGPRNQSILLLLTSLVFNLARTIILPVLPLYMLSVHLSDIQIGFEFAVLGVGTITFEPLVGALADKRNSKKILISIIALVSFCYILYPFAKDQYSIAVLQFFIGGFQASMTVYFRYFILELSGNKYSSRGFGFLGAIFSASSIAGPLIGGTLAVSRGLEFEFYLSTFVAIASMPLMIISRPEIQTQVSNLKKTRDNRPKLPFLELTILGVIAMTIFIGSSVYTSILPVIVSGSPFFGTAFKIGIILAIQNLALMIFQPIFGSMGSSRSRLWISFGLAMGSMMFVGLSVARSIWLVYILSFLEGVAFASVNPLALSRFVVRVPSAVRGTAIGVYGAAEDIGIISGPIILSQMWTRFGLGPAYSTIACIYGISLVAYLTLSLMRRRAKLDEDKSHSSLA